MKNTPSVVLCKFLLSPRTQCKKPLRKCQNISERNPLLNLKPSVLRQETTGTVSLRMEVIVDRIFVILPTWLVLVLVLCCNLLVLVGMLHQLG